MLRELRDRRGGPNGPTRLLAALVALGLVLLTAPLVLIPVARALADLLF